MAELYCTFWSRESVKRVDGPNSCRGCDVRTVAMARDGTPPEYFPQKCSHCTSDREKALAAVNAWKKDAESRERRYEELRKRADEGGGRGYMRPEQQFF
jgi:hypothetical protein